MEATLPALAPVPGSPGMVGTYSRKGRSPVDEAPSAAGRRGTRVSIAKEPNAQKDCSSVATADPAFWLKGVG